jgi:fructose-1,6-bisphosphatase
MHLVREGHLIFHGCVPVDEQGDYLSMVVAGGFTAVRRSLTQSSARFTGW